MAVLDPNYASIVYQATTKLLDLTIAAVRTRSRSVRQDNYALAAKIRYYLKALQYHPTYYDAEKANQILQCLIVTSGIQDYPTPPALSAPSAPAAISAVKGDKGDKGDRGDDGGGTDFAASSISSNTAVDTFPLSSAYAARWDYIVNGDAQRAGTIWGTWTEDGANVEYSEASTADINGSTSGVTFTVTYSGGNVQLNAIITSGVWSITGSRYFIPNQGTGVNVASTPLSYGNLFVGSAAGVPAQSSLVYVDTANTRVGVNTTSPTTTLSVVGTVTGSKFLSDTSNNETVSGTYSASKLVYGFSENRGIGYNTADNTVYFAMSSTVPLVVDDSGRVGIMTTSPTSELDVNGTITIRGGSPGLGKVLTSDASGLASWQTVAGVGSVTSVNASGGTTGLTFSGGPVTTSGTLTLSGTLAYSNGGTGQTFYTKGDLIWASAANTLSKLAIGSPGYVLKSSSGSNIVWGTISSGVADELQKDNGSGLLTGTNIFATGTSSNPTLTLGVGVTSANISAGSGGNLNVILGTNQSVTIRNTADTQRFNLGFSGSNAQLTASGSAISTLTISAGSKSVTLGGTALVYPADYSASYTDRSLVDRGYVTGILTGGTGTLNVNTLSALTVTGNTGTFTTLGIGTAYDGVNPLTISGGARQYTGSFQIDTGALRMGTTGDNLAYSAGVFTLNPTTNFVINKGIGQGTGIKHARVSTGTVTAGGTADVVVTWSGSAFADANYTVVATTQETFSANQGVKVMGVTAKTTTTCTVRVLNDFSLDRSATLNLIAIHD